MALATEVKPKHQFEQVWTTPNIQPRPEKLKRVLEALPLVLLVLAWMLLLYWAPAS